MKTVRHRYIAFEICKQPEAFLTTSSLIEAVISKLRLTKDQPAGFRFRILEYDATRSKGIVRTMPHTAVEWVKSLIRSLNEIHGKPVVINILGTSGTLKTLRSKYLAWNKSTKNNNSSGLNISTERDEPAVPL